MFGRYQGAFGTMTYDSGSLLHGFGVSPGTGMEIGSMKG
jgi:hypothetical protein